MRKAMIVLGGIAAWRAGTWLRKLFLIVRIKMLVSKLIKAIESDYQSALEIQELQQRLLQLSKSDFGPVVGDINRVRELSHTAVFTASSHQPAN